HLLEGARTEPELAEPIAERAVRALLVDGERQQRLGADGVFVLRLLEHLRRAAEGALGRRHTVGEDDVGAALLALRRAHRAAGAEPFGRDLEALEEIVFDDRSGTGGDLTRGAAVIALEHAALRVELHLRGALAAGEALRLYCFFVDDGGHGLALGTVVSCQA